LENPKLRPVQVLPAEASGRPIYIVRDASGLTDRAVTVSEDLLFVLHLMDGRHSQLDIRAEYMRRFGGFLFEDQLKELLRQLDDSLLLDSPRFSEFLDAARREFRGMDPRPASFAGSAYPSEREEIVRTFDGFFTSQGGPGEMPSPGEGAPPRAVVVPHIDMRAGGPCLAWAYKRLSEKELPDLFVILGTGHSGPENNFAVTSKDFATPLGVARTDKDFVAALLDKCATDFTAGELAHKSEHSVEFQVVFLQYLFEKLGHAGDGPAIVPALCSFGYSDVAGDGEGRSRIEEFTSALRATAEERGRSVCYIASADLAHLGPRYGDEKGMGPSELVLVRSRDLEMLGNVERGDADAFARFVEAEQDARRICGFGCIYTMLKAIEPSRGTLLNYSFTPVDTQGSIVSFASLVFE